MKYLFPIVLCFYYVSMGQSHLLGKISQDELNQAPHNEWFTKNYKSYTVHSPLVNNIKKDLKRHTIKIFLGTWCGDSKKEVPAFLKILEDANFPKEQLEIICLDRESSVYKQSPGREEQGLNIHRVPAFIIYKNGTEVNRIVEHPISSLERDLASIVKGERYTPNYRVVSILEQQFKSKSIEEIKTMESELLHVITEYAQGAKELNTYAYVKLRANELEKAVYIFELNNKAFPLNYVTYESLSEGYYETNAYDKAKTFCYKTLSMDSNNKWAKSLLEKLDNL